MHRPCLDALNAIAEDEEQRGAAASNAVQRVVQEITFVCIDVSNSMSRVMEPGADGKYGKYPFPANLPTKVELLAPEYLTPEQQEALGKTRLAAVKSLFFRFRDQTTNYMDTYEVSHLIGLLSFSDKFELHVARPTANFQQFEEMLEAMQYGGRTDIYGAIEMACAELEKEKLGLHRTANLRVLVLSDGVHAV